MEILNCLLDHYGLPALTRAQRHANQEESTLAEVRSLLQGKQTHAHDRLRLAIVGHSLGGLYSRNALGLLHRGGYFHSQQGVLTPFVRGNPACSQKVHRCLTTVYLFSRNI